VSDAFFLASIRNGIFNQLPSSGLKLKVKPFINGQVKTNVSRKLFLFEQRPSKLSHSDAKLWLVVTETALIGWDYLTDEKRRVLSIPHLPGQRTNDGRIDPSGKVWIGTMRNESADDTDSLYRLRDDDYKNILNLFIISNDMLWQDDV